MSRFFGKQNDFTAGEVTPRFYGRFDLPQYEKGAKSLQNFSVYPQGGISRRMGSGRLIDGYDETNDIRLHKFSLTLDSQYLIEIGHNYIRIGDYDATTQETFLSNGYNSDDIWDITFSVVDNSVYMYHTRYITRILSFDGATWSLSLYDPVNGPYLARQQSDKEITLTIQSYTYTLRFTSQESTAFDSVALNDYIEWYENGVPYLGQVTTHPGAGSGYVIVTPVEHTVSGLDPSVAFYESGGNIEASKTGVFNSGLSGSWFRFYDQADSQKVNWAKLGSFQGFKSDAGNWVLAGGADATYVEYMAIDGSSIDDATGNKLWSLDDEAGNQITDSVTITDEVNQLVILSDTANTFTSLEINRWLLLNFNNIPFNCQITSVDSGTQVTCSSIEPPPRDTHEFANKGRATKFFRGAYYGLDGAATSSYPFCGTFYQQRHITSGSAVHPDHAFYTITGDSFDFALTDSDGEVLATSGGSFKVEGDEFKRTRWMVSVGTVIMGSEGGEWVMDGGDQGDALTPAGTRITQQSSRGSLIPPVVVGNSVIYTQRSGTKVYEMEYDLRKRAYSSLDISVLSEHLLREEGVYIVDIVFPQEPNNQVWFVRSDGTISALTYMKEQEVYAWQHHIFGDESGDAVVESVTSLVSPDLTEDSIFMVVKRGNKRWIERIAPQFEPTSAQDKEDMIYLDGHTKVTIGSPTTTITGLSAYEGQEVSVVVDGANHPTRTVTSGQIELQQEASSYVYVGFNYTSTLHTLPLGISSREGNLYGKLMRPYAVVVKMLDSVGFRIGKELDELEDQWSQPTVHVMGQSPDLVSEDKKVLVNNTYDRQGSYYIVMDLPYPLTITSIYPEVDINQ